MSTILLNSFLVVSLTYTVTPSTVSVNEGNSVTFTVNTTGFGSGTLYYTIEGVSGTVNNSDFSSPSNAVTAGGSVTITNNSGSFNLTIAEDALTETESFLIRLRINSTSGEIVATSNTITILPSVSGETSYTSAGTYSFVAPAGVNSVCVVCVGGGGGGLLGSSSGGGGGGGGLGWKNNIAVIPGQSYTVVVGQAGAVDTDAANQITVNTDGGTSYFINTSTVAGFGGGKAYWVDSVGSYSGAGGGYVGDGGGSGGAGSDFAQLPAAGTRAGAGGGAGGYSGNGGSAAPLSGQTYAGTVNTASESGSGGGGGAGGYGGDGQVGGGGGGVGIFGIGSNGAGGINRSSGNGDSGGGGSGGANGEVPTGGAYGGGGGSRDTNTGAGGAGGVGAVRIIWGTGRSFPNNAA